jgi:hypothetical protein
MAQQARLDVLQPQRLAQQRVREQVDLPDREVVRGAPVGVQAGQLAGLQSGDGRCGGTLDGLGS